MIIEHKNLYMAASYKGELPLGSKVIAANKYHDLSQILCNNLEKDLRQYITTFEKFDKKFVCNGKKYDYVYLIRT